MIYTEAHPDFTHARAREKQLKNFGRAYQLLKQRLGLEFSRKALRDKHPHGRA
jgi:hypothetical protein